MLTKIFKLKDWNPGKNYVVFRKIQTKFAVSYIIKLKVDDVEKEYFLKKCHGKLPQKTIKKINRGKYVFHYKCMIDGKPVYKLTEFWSSILFIYLFNYGEF